MAAGPSPVCRSAACSRPIPRWPVLARTAGNRRPLRERSRWDRPDGPGGAAPAARPSAPWRWPPPRWWNRLGSAPVRATQPRHTRTTSPAVTDCPIACRVTPAAMSTSSLSRPGSRAVSETVRITEPAPAVGQACFLALRKSLFSWEMTSSGISLGHAAAHSPMLVQPPKPSKSCWLTMLTTRASRSG